VNPSKFLRHWLAGRRRLALVALIGALASMVYVVAPVHQNLAVHTFRPIDADASGLPGDPAIAALPLVRNAPDRFEARFGCSAAGSSQFRSVTTGNWDGRLPTFPALGQDLQVRLADEVFVNLGGRTIVSGMLEFGPECEATVSFSEDTWTLQTNLGEWSGSGPPPRIAEALVVGPTASDPVTEFVVSTRDLGTSPTIPQLLLALIAIASLAVVGFGLVHRGGAPSRSPAARWGGADYSVVMVLIIWWLVIPANLDDGWSAAMQHSFEFHGEISTVLSSGAAPLPFGYWFEWLSSLWTRPGMSPLLMRAPAIVVGVVTWAGLRAVGARLGVTVASYRLMAAAFAVGFGAWGVTLRPEPMVAMLAVFSVWCAIRFHEGGRGWLLPLWALFLALGVTIHPAGLVVAAPLVVVWRPMLSWLREGPRARETALASALFALTLLLILLFLDSNLGAKLDAVGAHRDAAHGLTVVDEAGRYLDLGVAPYGTTLRRLSIGLILLPIGLRILRRGRPRSTARIPALSLLVGLAFLAITPSKWPWHFGGLIGVAAVAIAVESARHVPPPSGWRREPLSSRSIAAFAVMGTVGLVFLALSVGTSWAPFDLRVGGWWPGLDLSRPLTIGAFLLVVLVLCWLGWRGLAGSVGVAVLVVSVGAMALVASTLGLDAVRAEAWTFTQQNMRSLVGSETCGLGDEVSVPVPGTLLTLPAADGLSPEPDESARSAGFEPDGALLPGGFAPHAVTQFRPDGINAVLPLPGIETFGTFASDEPDQSPRSGGSSWYAVGGDAVVMAVMGSLGPDSSGAVQWGRSGEGTIADAGVVELEAGPGFHRDWALVPLAVPDGADRVRVLLRDAGSEENDWVAAAAPMSIETATIRDLADHPGADFLVGAPLALYFPCVSGLVLDDTIADPPGVIVQSDHEAWQTTLAPAVATDRYYVWPVELDPPLPAASVGAHSGDPYTLIYVSQEHLTGTPARVNGSFERVPG